MINVEVSTTCPTPDPSPWTDEGGEPRSRTVRRAIGFRALAELENLALAEQGRPRGEAGERGVVRGRETLQRLLRALREAWGQGVTLTGLFRPEELQARLLAGGYLERPSHPRSLAAALALAARLCPALVERATWTSYALGLEDLLAGGPTLARLEAWVAAVVAYRYGRVRGGARPGERESLPESAIDALPISASDRDHKATCTPVFNPLKKDRTRAPSPHHGTPLLDNHRAREAAAWSALVAGGPSVQGQGGDRRLFVALCTLGDFDLAPEQEERLALRFATELAEPAWAPIDVWRKLRSARENRRRPRGIRLRPVSRAGPGDHQVRPGASDPPTERSDLAERSGALWLAGEFCHGDPEVRAWLLARGLDPHEVARRDLARVMSAETGGPAFPWSHRLLVDLVDVWGRRKGLRGRVVATPGAPVLQDLRPEKRRRAPPGAKDLCLRGARVRGLVLACPQARALLARAQRPQGPVILVEGTPDFLAACLHWRGAGAVIGLVAGAWSPELADKLRGLEVLVATHDDRGGDALAAEVLRDLDAVRLRPHDRGLDLCDLLAQYRALGRDLFDGG